MRAAKSKAVRWDGVWWGGYKKVSLAWSLYFFSFLLHLREVKYHWPTVGKAGNSIHNRSIIFDEERLDPHGVGNLPFFQWQLSSTYGVMQGIRVKCMHYWCFNNESCSIYVCSLQTKEGAGNTSWKYVDESRRTCRTADWIGQELNITSICDGKQARKQHKLKVFASYQHHQRADCQSKVT